MDKLEFCYQITYMSLDIHKHEIIEFNDIFVRYKTIISRKIYKGYHSELDCKWFKTYEEAEYFVINEYYNHFSHLIKNCHKEKI